MTTLEPILNHPYKSEISIVSLDLLTSKNLKISQKLGARLTDCCIPNNEKG